jgi:uncharacterized iron-regulated membrane protein
MSTSQFLTVLLAPVGLLIIGLAVLQYDRWEHRRERVRSEEEKSSTRH